MKTTMKINKNNTIVELGIVSKKANNNAPVMQRTSPIDIKKRVVL
ncbi:hypothetical protein [Methanococcoides burtonii]|nr:hypothetical protein [Methanococcoides burtonii]